MSECDVVALPGSIGKLSKLRTLNACYCKVKDLPQSIVKLDPSCLLCLYTNPVEAVICDIAEEGCLFIQAYLDDLGAADSS